MRISDTPKNENHRRGSGLPEHDVPHERRRAGKIPGNRREIKWRHREYEAFDRSLDVQISRLRKLVESDPSKPRYIQTVWGVGYVFVPDGAN